MEIQELRVTVTEMKNSLDVFNSRFEVPEKRTSKLEISIVKSPIWRTERKSLKKNNQSLGDLWDKIRCTNIFVMGISEGEERENGTGKKKKLEEMTKNFWNV